MSDVGSARSGERDPARGASVEVKYQAAIETAHDGFWVVDTSGCILEVNDAYVRRSGYTRDELLGMNVAELEARDSAAEIASRIELLRTDGHALFETAHRAKDGATWPLEITCSYWPIEDGRIFVFLRDLTQRRMSESLLKTRLRLSEAADSLSLDELIQLTLDEAELLTGSTIAFFHFVDPDQQHLRLQTWSTNTMRRMCTAEGKGSHYAISKAGIWTDCVHVRAPVIHNDYASVPHRKGMPEGHAPVQRFVSVPILRGGLITAIIGVGNKPADYQDGDVAVVEQLASVAIDIIARKEAEARLRESEARFRSMVETASEGVWVMDGQHRTTFVNPAMCSMLGYTSDELAGRRVEELMFEADLPAHRARMEGRHRGDAGHYENRFRRRDGSECWCLVSATAVLGADGTFGGSFAMFSDITERKRRERQLAVREAISATLAGATSALAATPKVLSILAGEHGWSFGALWQWDERTRRLGCFGTWTEPGLAKDATLEALRARTIASDDDLASRVRASGTPLSETSTWSTLAIPVTDGARVTGVLEFVGRPRRAPDPEALEWLVDVAARLGEFLHRRWVEEQVQRFVAIGPALIYMLVEEEAGFRCTWVSDNIEAITGYRAEEIGDTWWFDGVHPDDRARVAAAHPRPYTIEHQVLEFRFRHREGHYVWIRDEKRRLRPADACPTEIVGSWSDVTERVLLEEQLRQSQKLEAIGRLAGGVAHDFNNLLTVINGYSDLLLASLDPTDSMATHLVDIRSAGERASDLTRQLLSFSRKQVVEPRVLDLNAVVSNQGKLLRRMIGEKVELTVNLDPSVTPVRIDPGQVQQVLTNLVVNARDAMPDGGMLRIETRAVEWSAADCRLHASRRPGRFTVLDVIDTGCGMTDEVKARIFEPFFTTKGPGQGTGLGLSTVFGIVAQADGVIEVETAPGCGTTVSVALAAVPMSSTESEPEHELPPSGGHETILLVEDEAIVRGVARAALEAKGYVVLEAPDGPHALEVFESHRDEIDLLVTDVVMPRMNGDQLAAELQRRAPGLRVLFVSGYSEHPLAVGAALLQKPFRSAVLAARVRELLDGR